MRLLEKLFNKVKTYFRDLWNRGIGEIIKEKRYIKLMVDVSIFVIWAIFAIMFTSPLLDLLGIAFVVTPLSSMFGIEDSTLCNFVNPLILLVAFAVGATIWSYCPSVVILWSLVMIPRMTAAFEEMGLHSCEC